MSRVDRIETADLAFGGREGFAGGIEGGVVGSGGAAEGVVGGAVAPAVEGEVAAVAVGQQLRAEIRGSAAEQRDPRSGRAIGGLEGRDVLGATVNSQRTIYMRPPLGDGGSSHRAAWTSWRASRESWTLAPCASAAPLVT
jgi:hypothetical protein